MTCQLVVHEYGHKFRRNEMTESCDAVKFLMFHSLSVSREKISTVFAAVCVLGLSKAGLEPLV